MSKPKLGSGKRFAAVEKSAAASGARDPAAVAAAAGRKKYGSKKMEKMAEKGRARAEHLKAADMDLKEKPGKVVDENYRHSTHGRKGSHEDGGPDIGEC